MSHNTVVRKFCFTLNNYSEEDEQRIQSNAPLFKYIVYGRERAPRSGTPHLQGFGNLRRPSRFSAIKTIIGNNAHIEKAKGNDLQNKEYCEKMAIFGVQDSLLAKDNEMIWKKSLEILEDQISIGMVLSLRINPRISSIIEECAHYLRSFVHNSLAILKHK